MVHGPWMFFVFGALAMVYLKDSKPDSTSPSRPEALSDIFFSSSSNFFANRLAVDCLKKLILSLILRNDHVN